MSIDRGMDKKDVAHIYLYNEILLSHEKQNNAICKDMDGPRDYQTEWNKSEKEKQMLCINTYM